MQFQLWLPYQLEGLVVKAVIDTGAEVTAISTSLCEKIPEGNRPMLQESGRCLVVAEEGKRLKTQGVIEANVTIGKLAVKWEVYVAPIREEVLLGCDFIDEYNITINTKRGIKIEGTWIGCEVVRKSDKIARVFVKESVTVPANSEIIIEGTGKQAEYIDTRYASLEPFYDDSSHMLVARFLVDPFNDIIPVRVANLENFPLKLKKNLMLGEMHLIEDFCYMDNTDVGAEVCSNNNYGLLKMVCSADIAPITEVHMN
jgi:predicted aspartyl protease